MPRRSVFEFTRWLARGAWHRTAGILRHLTRTRRKAWLDREEHSLIPPRDLWIGPGDSIAHYFRWIWEYLAYLTLAVRLQRHDAVLELGCGHGRLARGLLMYLRYPGRYVGLDIDAKRIDDARARFTRRWPNFEFVRADVRNATYNPSGAFDAETYTFPFPDNTFDVIFAASLFTHLLPAEAERYLAESRRVLKPDGRCLFSCFVLDRYQPGGTTSSRLYEFDHDLPGYLGVAVRDPLHPDEAIAYREDVLMAMADRANLAVPQILPGLWSENSSWAVNEQDLMILTRRVDERFGH